MKATRIALVAFGVALLLLGAVVLFGTVNPKKYLGLASWFILALIVHDGVISAVTFGVAFGLRKGQKKQRIPGPVIAIVEGALAVISVFAIIVLPEILKQAIGTKNPTILPLDYTRNLLLFWAAIVVLAAVAIAAYYAVTRRQKPRPSVSQA
jgi:hypothetical protein